MRDLLPCRGCLGPLGQGAEAGLCGHCWSGLLPLPEDRCGGCALVHGSDRPCPDPVAWTWGDACWVYQAGRPPLGALLVPGIKRGELGWKAALLGRLDRVQLPAFTQHADLVCSAPTARLRRWHRGFDLAEEAGARVARRLGKPMARLLRKGWWTRAQAGLPEGQRRRMGACVSMAREQRLTGEAVLVVDDVWTTGTTLLRCAQALARAGAGEVLVLALFRAWSARLGRESM